MKKWFTVIIGFCAAGTILANWLGPKMIGWYFEPPVEIGINCRPAVEWGMAKLQWVQLIGMLGGLTVGAIVWFLLRKRPSQGAQ